MTEHATGWDARAARESAHTRQGGLCALCWKHMGALEGDWHLHHRLRRALMPKASLWCPCDLVGLHSTCHGQGPTAVHDHPERARELGLILDTSDDPRLVPVPVWGWMLPGPVLLDCDGMVVSTL